MPLAAAAQPARPNIVFILVDDLRFDELGCTGHPFAETPNVDRLAREGASFRNAFACTPLCSPSRATFLTGHYPRKTGIIDNTDRSPRSHQLVTWPRLLHEAGYETGFFGKWHMGVDDSPRPGFDHWVSFPGQGESMDPVFNVNGKTAPQKGYITDLLTDEALRFMQRRRSAPFCVYLSHKAIHPNITQAPDGSTNRPSTSDTFIPAPRHRELYKGKTPPRRPNYLKPPKGKAALERRIEGVEPLGPATGTDDETILNRMRMMKAIDESLGRLLKSLESAGQLDNTAVIFTSDHGYFYGEHCLGAERRLAYEEAIRIPLVARFPRAFTAGSRPEAFTLAVDIAPTCLSLAGVPVPAGLHGHSVTAPRPRESFLIEYYSDTVFKRIHRMGYEAVRTRRWKYIRYRDLVGMDELYDLAADPYELNNVAGSAPGDLAKMKSELERLRAELV